MRPTKDEYMMAMAQAAASRATCDRGRSGAVIAVDGVVVSSGYVGAARGLPHCDEAGHLLRKVTYEDGSEHIHCQRTAHAEGNAIVQAARRVVQGGTLYCKMEPCLRCTVDLINAGIKRVVAEYRYHGAGLSREWLRMAGVQLDVINDTEPSYEPEKARELGINEMKALCREALGVLRHGAAPGVAIRLLEKAIEASGD